MTPGGSGVADLTVVLDSVYRLYAARSHQQLFATAVEVLRDLTGADTCIAVDADVRTADPRVVEIGHTMVVPVADDVVVRLSRVRCAFTAAENARVARLRPHLAQAYDVVARLELLAPAHPDAAEALTAREREVLELVGMGLTDRQIGARLHLSARTVSKHVENLKGKLGVRTRTAAATRVIRTRAG